MSAAMSSMRRFGGEFSEQLIALMDAFLHEILKKDSVCSLPRAFVAALLRRESLEQLDALNCAPHLKAQARLLCTEESFLTVGEGVPCYPLYKYISHALCEWLKTCEFPRRCETIQGFLGTDSWEQNNSSCTPTILQMLVTLKELVYAIKFELHLHGDLLLLLQDKSNSIVEIMCDSYISSIASGDFVLVNDLLLGEIQQHKSLDAVPNSYKVYRVPSNSKSVIPGAVDANSLTCRELQTKEIKGNEDILSIYFHPLHEIQQPLRIIGDILDILGIDGIKALMGFRSTVGSISDALPPPRSDLLVSFLTENAENVLGSALTVGARALTKHVHRSAAGWWGPCTGNDDAKNQQALNIINHLIQHSCWLNIHYMPPDSSVFEIRVKDGYGARWIGDGTKFRGFLEPSMEAGHLKKWRH